MDDPRPHARHAIAASPAADINGRRDHRSFGTAFAGMVFSKILSLWSWSWRRTHVSFAGLDRLLGAGDRVLVLFWHGKYLPIFPLARGRGAIVFTSRSWRGEVIAHICRRFGYEPVMLSASGPGRSLKFVENAMHSHITLVAIAVDGPRGPYHNIPGGVIRLAGDLGYRIVPLAVTGRPKHSSARRWDRREIPLPFASVALKTGEPIDIPHGISADEVEQWRLQLHMIMEELDADIRAVLDGRTVGSDEGGVHEL